MLLRKTAPLPEEVFLPQEPGALDAPFLETPFDKHGLLEDEARLQRALLQKEIDLLRARVDVIRTQIGVVVVSGATCVESHARAQLGPYPWAKFGALVGASYFLTNFLKKLPFGSFAATAIPLGMLVIEYRRNRHEQ